ncbi:MAG: carbon-nitrogen family hydrolase [Armatimonadetes bacterium]|nr:carbon-nitrogen family hydrolase [Armatimonadota bacterium]
MIVVGCQLDMKWEDKQGSFEVARELLHQSPPPPGALVVFPEMFSTGFSMDVEKIAEGESREAEAFLQSISREYRVATLGGVVNREGDGMGRNQSVVFAPDGSEVSRYNKIFPFTPGGESKRYRAGEEIVLFEWQGFNVATFICYDLRFPEIFRCAAVRGADLITVIASWPIARWHHWVTLLQARAIENQTYVVGVNRCGDDPAFHYPGRSIVVHPDGQILADAGDSNAVISAELDLKELQDYRQSRPFLRDMRSEWLSARS